MKQKKFIKIGAGAAAVLISGIFLVNSLYQNVSVAYAKESLPGVETIVATNGNNNPYLILEVVPDKKDAAFGFLLKGEEPISEGKSYRDLPVEAERTDKIKAFGDSVSGNSVPLHPYADLFGDTEDKPLSISEYKEIEDGSLSFSLRGRFMPNEDGDYISTFKEADYKLVTAPDTGYQPGMQKYNKYVEFPEIKKGGKVATFSTIASLNGAKMEVDVDGQKYETAYKYTIDLPWRGDTSPYQVPNLADYEGKAVFRIEHNQYTYFGSVEKLGGLTTTSGAGSAVGDDSTVSGNTVSSNEMPPTSSTPETTPPETTEPETTTPQETTAPETTQPESIESETVVSGSFITYALNSTQVNAAVNAEIYAIHTSDGKYMVFDPADNVTIDGIATELVDENSVGKGLAIGSFSEDEYAGDYYISALMEPQNTPHKTPFYGFKQYNWFNPDENGDYYLAADAEYGYGLCDKALHPEEDVDHFDWTTDYSNAIFDTIKYEGGIENKEWFKKYVFDREEEEYDDLIIDVKTVTMEEFNSYDLSTVDLIYFAGGQVSYPTDILPNQARAVFLNVVKERMPVIMNESFVQNNKSLVNISKLGTLLRQADLASVDIKENSDKKTALEKAWENADYWTGLEKKKKAADAVYGVSYVNKSVFIFDDVLIDDTGNAQKLVSTKFHQTFVKEQIAYGFAEVEAEINNENLYRQLSGKDKLPTDVSVATAIRYIINFASQRNVIKSKINVLEIQPCASAQYNEEQLLLYNYKNTENRASSVEREILRTDYIAENWATQFKDKTENIQINTTHTKEFIGKIEDLNENYDLIYIGMDTSTMNTEIEGGKKTNRTLYNDSNMNGLIYAHTGDLASIPGDRRYVGLLNPNDVASEPGMKDDYGNYRYSGNDITPDKLRDLKEYIDAGFPVIFADGFFEKSSDGTYTVNYAKVDTTSYMYEFAQYVIQKDYMNKRAFVDSEVKDSDEQGVKKELSNCLNLSKLSVEMTKMPTPYKEFDTASYLKAINGVYVLEYEFNLKNDAALSILDTKYDCRLYIDSNVDGRYSADEEIDGLQVFEWKNGLWEPVYTTLTSTTEGNVEKFELMAGRYYKMQRQLPAGYVGVMPWKLSFEQNDNSLVRKSVVGYSAVPIAVSERQVIKVLQLTSGGSGNGNFGVGLTLDLTGDTMKDLFRQVQDFDIQVTKMPVQDYIKTVRTVDNPNDFSEYFAVLNQYDMLVLGFTDGYIFGNGTDNQAKAAALAIRKYISDGRSVLFTHDTTSYRNTNEEWGYFFNRYIRDVVGMDRYGVMTQIAQKEGFIQADSVFDKAWISDNKSDTGRGSVYRTIQGYTDGRLAVGAAANVNNNPYLFTARNAVVRNTTGQYGGQAMYVTEVNKGQITEYPFKIPSRFEVASTHTQYYQLNLETNSRDDNQNDDIVVWYCISDVNDSKYDDFYQAVPNDTRNNYYIYNKGNVTYSGVGHSTVNKSIEQRLFVNTMVAAYNAGVHPPRVTYKESGKKEAAQIEYTYMPYDEAIGTDGAFIEEECKIFFEVSDSNFVQGTKTIETSYYLETAANAPGASPVLVDGNEVWMLELSEAQISSMSKAETNEILTGEARHKVTNNTTYKLTIPTTVLNMSGKNTVNFYISSKTTYNRNEELTATEKGYYKIGVVKTQLFELE